jgi:hypothetical protein
LRNFRSLFSTPKNRELFVTTIAVAGILEMTSASAYAQTDPIDFCRNSSSDDKARIECLEDAIRGLMPLAAAENAESASPVSPIVRPPAPVVASSDESPAALAPPKGIGAEQVVARQERDSKDRGKLRKERIDKEAITARLVDFARTSAGRLILVLDNGQVWAQRAGDNQEVRLRDGDTPTVRIRRGMISGYRIEFSSPNTTIVAERLK